MASTSDHVGRAENNETFYQSFPLDSTPYLDWAITALFYSSVHYVDAGLHEHRTRRDPSGIHPESHEERTSAVQRNFPRIYRQFRYLKDRSEDARYRLMSFTPQEVRELEQREFRGIRQLMRTRLRLP